MLVVAAPDKFRGTASGREVAAAIARAARAAGWECVELPVADGGEGTLDALGGANRETLVTGPLGDPVRAGWRYAGRTAVVEMSRASGLELVGGAAGNRPLEATTAGTGELIAEAVAAGARRVIVGVGGSATTDGGLGALRALEPHARLRGVSIEVACDVRIGFVEAARVFAPQKGASAVQVQLLTNRLEALAATYEEQYGVDVRTMRGAGAAGGLAGGLAAIGASLVEGFDVVADEIELAEAIEDADLVITGEGFVDEQSFDGKAVGGVAELAAAAGVPVVAVAGQVFDGPTAGVEVVSLADRYGLERALSATIDCVETAVSELLGRRRR